MTHERPVSLRRYSDGEDRVVRSSALSGDEIAALIVLGMLYAVAWWAL